MLAHVPRILTEYDMLAAGRHFPVAHERNLSIMLLAAAKFSDLKWKREAVRRAKELVLKDNDAYLRSWLGVVESTSLRGQGNLSGSVSALENHIRNTTVPGLDAGMESDARFNAQRGELTLSYAETLLREGQLEVAKAELEAWKPLNPGAPSSMEKIVVQSRDNLLGRLLKDAGRFEEALPIFESLLREVGLVSFVSTGWQLVMLNGLSELYCELGRPLDGEIVLKQQMELIHQRKWETLNTGRRLQLAVIESFVRRGDFEAAETRLERLRVMFEGIDEMDEFQKTQNLRVWIGFAQIAHLRKNWNQASFCWDKALVLTESAGWTSTFNHAVILFSLAQVLYQLGDKEEAANQLEIAETSFKAEGRRYWMVGMGSYWFDYVHVPLGEFGPEVVVHQISPSIHQSLGALFERPVIHSPNISTTSTALVSRSTSLPERPLSHISSPPLPSPERCKSDTQVEAKQEEESSETVQLSKSAVGMGGIYPTDASGSQIQTGAMMFTAPSSQMM
jgi:tetratricopeptide (TPR) repeat protein